MKLIKTNENNEPLQYPFSLAELRREFPSVSFPSVPTSEDLEPFNCFIVKETVPFNNASEFTHDLVSNAVFVNEEWIETWSLEPVLEEEAARRVDVYVKGLDYKGFWKAFVRSDSYTNLKTAASTDLASNVLATELISIFSDAKTGNLDVESMQVGINASLAKLETIDPVLKRDTEELLRSYKMDYYLSNSDIQIYSP